ncbi:MAG: CPBP family intramembrane metalloprotease [Lachnospiraceae bacterium]|nr:CPBP family intramembrane metalloprotease [Lachnospiraceae bacterium]
MRNTNKLKILLWLFIVYILSFICYVPSLLEQHGIFVANGLFFVKYLFVCIPAITAILFLIYEHNLKKYFVQMFLDKIPTRHILRWIIFVVVGILVSYCYSVIVEVDLFQSSYSPITTLLISCIYLFITGLVEEIAWRGFLLERVSFEKKSIFNIIFVGVAWTIWHMPMWIIRNSLCTEQIIYFCIWTILVSYVIGTTYYQCQNVLLIALIHATFNISYLAPVQYNVIILAIVIAIGTLFTKKRTELEK